MPHTDADFLARLKRKRTHTTFASQQHASGSSAATAPASAPSSPWEHLRGLEPLSLCDWPGRPSSVLFLGGCNLRCPTCHNATLAFAPHKLPVIYKPDVLRFLEKKVRFLCGLSITGGEATMHPGIADFLAELRGFGLPIKLDTNGMRPDVVAKLLDAGLVDTFAVDVKAPWHKYPEVTGHAVTQQLALDRMAAIFTLAVAHPSRFYFRTTKVPTLDSGDFQTIRSYLPEGHVLTLQEYVEPPTAPETAARTRRASDSQTTTTTTHDTTAGSKHA